MTLYNNNNGNYNGSGGPGSYGGSSYSYHSYNIGGGWSPPVYHAPNPNVINNALNNANSGFSSDIPFEKIISRVDFIDMESGRVGYSGPVMFKKLEDYETGPIYFMLDPDQWINSYLVITSAASNLGKYYNSKNKPDPNLVYFKMFYRGQNNELNYTWGTVPRVIIVNKVPSYIYPDARTTPY